MGEPDPRHLDEDTVILLAQGALAGHALERAEQHLSRCDSCRALLAESIDGAEIADPNATHSFASSSPSLPEGELEVPPAGTVLVDKYEVESVLGSGGMGVVLAARHLMLGSKVAIKVLRRPGPSEVARFLREARVSAQIRNRHIARVFDFGQLPNGAPFLVMEYLEGRDLAQCIAHEPLPVTTAVEFVLQACEALAQVHALGIVHRDLKPANLFVTEDQGHSVIKVLDFGIFKSIAGAALNVGDASTQLTGQHALIGSPVYMSPEQMMGQEIDVRSDVWALGVIMYELLTRELPFGERTLSALAVAVATEEPRPPSQLRREIPRALEQIILRCLRKQPGERYPNAGALREALRTMPISEPTSRAKTYLAVAIVALCAGAAWLWSQTNEPAPTVRATALPVVAPPPEQPKIIEPEVLIDARVEEPLVEDAGTYASPPRTKAKRSKRTKAASLRPIIGPTDTPD